MIHLIYIHFIVNAFIAGVMVESYATYTSFRKICIFVGAMLLGWPVLLEACVRTALINFWTWIDGRTQINFWLAWVFAPRMNKHDEAYLWQINQSSTALHWKECKKPPFGGRMFLRALKALNEYNNYQP